MSIQENIKDIQVQLKNHCQLVAVSKTKPAEAVLEAYNGGQRIFGENKVQELQWKSEELPKDIEWHMIGHLQSNKVKYIAPFIHLIHGVDSLKLLKEINKQALKSNRVIPVLLQVYIANEKTKFGLSVAEVDELVVSPEFLNLKNIEVHGLMGMATNTDDKVQVRQEFKSLKNLFERLKTQHFEENRNFKEISMGMSGDYQIAMEEGSTLVRIGSSIFGARNYTV